MKNHPLTMLAKRARDKAFSRFLYWRKFPSVFKYRGIHSGTECYIFGDGASIRHYDLSDFADKDAIILNMFAFHSSLNALKLKYELIMDPYWFFPLADLSPFARGLEWDPVQSAYRKIIRAFPELIFFVNGTNWPFLTGKNIEYIDPSFLQKQDPGNSLLQHPDCFGASLFASLFWATYLGYEKVYLVGFDYLESPPKVYHWYENRASQALPYTVYDGDFFESVKEKLEVVVLTPRDTSPFFSSITYLDYTGKPLRDYSNADLLTPETMKALSWWPDYKIY